MSIDSLHSEWIYDRRKSENKTEKNFLQCISPRGIIINKWVWNRNVTIKKSIWKLGALKTVHQLLYAKVLYVLFE